MTDEQIDTTINKLGWSSKTHRIEIVSFLDLTEVEKKLVNQLHLYKFRDKSELVKAVRKILKAVERDEKNE